MPGTYCALLRATMVLPCVALLVSAVPAAPRAGPQATRRAQVTRQAPSDQQSPGSRRSLDERDASNSVNIVTAAVPQEELTAVVPAGQALDDLVQIAMSSSPNLRQAAAQVRAARGRAYQAGLYPNPILYAASPQWTGSISQYDIFVGQDVISKGKLRLDRAALSRVAQQAELSFVRTRFELLTAVRQNFFSALVVQERVAVLEDLLRIAIDSQQAAERLHRGGEGTRVDAIMLEIERDRASVGLESAIALLQSARRQLAATIGQPNMPVDRLVGNLSVALPDFEQVALQRGVVTQNALANIARAEIAHARIVVRRAEVEPFPNFNFQGGFQYAVEPPLHDQAYAQFSMMLPLWNRNQGGIRAARADYAGATARLSRVQNELAGQAALALGNYRAANQLVDRHERAILPKARRTLEIIKVAYARGEFDLLRLLRAQQTYVEANLGYLDAQQRRWDAAAEIAGLLQVDRFP